MTALLSEVGQKLPCERLLIVSALPPVVTELRTSLEVRFVPTTVINLVA